MQRMVVLATAVLGLGLMVVPAANALTVGPVTVNTSPPLNCVSLNVTSQSHGTLVKQKVCLPLPGGGTALVCTATGSMTFSGQPDFPDFGDWFITGAGTCTVVPTGTTLRVAFSGEGAFAPPSCGGVGTDRYGVPHEGVTFAVDATFTDPSTGAKTSDSETWTGAATYSNDVGLIGIGGLLEGLAPPVPGALAFGVSGTSATLVGAGEMRPSSPLSPRSCDTSPTSFAWVQTT